MAVVVLTVKSTEQTVAILHKLFYGSGVIMINEILAVCRSFEDNKPVVAEYLNIVGL